VLIHLEQLAGKGHLARGQPFGMTILTCRLPGE
jgi:hypothetical protein